MAAKWPIDVTVGKRGSINLPAKVQRLLGIRPGAKLSILVATMDVFKAPVAGPLQKHRAAEEPEPQNRHIRPNHESRAIRTQH